MKLNLSVSLIWFMSYQVVTSTLRLYMKYMLKGKLKHIKHFKSLFEQNLI